MGQIIEHKATEVAPRAVVTPMEMLDRALSTNASVETLAQLMNLQERWEAGQARKAFDAAISAAKSKIGPITRNATGHNNKRYADFAAIATVVDPILSEHGLSYRFKTSQGDRINVTCVVSHKDGHSEETTLSGPPDTSGSKNSIQAIGSTLTYLQRYSLNAALGLSASNDDDGANSNNSGAITSEQRAELQGYIEALGDDVVNFCAWMKVQSLAEIRADQFQKAKQALQAKAAKNGVRL